MHLSNRDPNPEDIILKVDDWIAECQSLQPDRSLSFALTGSSWDALCLIYLLSHIAHFYWISDDITRKIAQKAYLSNYEGGWELVQQALEQDLQTPQQFYEWFLQSHSPEEFFGNLRKRAKRLLGTVRYKKRDPQRSAKRSQRTRGYRDKGTYVPPDRPRVDPPEKDPKIDRRKLVRHPLIYEGGENEDRGESGASMSLKE